MGDDEPGENEKAADLTDHDHDQLVVHVPPDRDQLILDPVEPAFHLVEAFVDPLHRVVNALVCPQGALHAHYSGAEPGFRPLKRVDMSPIRVRVRRLMQRAGTHTSLESAPSGVFARASYWAWRFS